ncbi:MAG: hypothetical protein ACPK7O_04960 [Methanobacterium sp.]
MPKYSFYGASAATIITEFIIFIMMFTYISRYFSRISII